MSSSFLRPAAYIAVLGSLALAGPAAAATLAVDDDGADCPAAPYTSVQAAVDAAASGDTIAICAGHYAEGPGTPGTNALTIQKDLALKGAGADLVTISPKATTPTGGRILEDTPSLRNGVGDVVAVVGSPSAPVTVDVSGVTIDGYAPGGKPVAVEAGLVFLDGRGSVTRSRVTNVVTSEGDNAYTVPGGYRGAQPGIGIAQLSNALQAPSDGTRFLNITRTRVDKYNQAGILIDSGSDPAPQTASGAINALNLKASQVVGRTQCANYLGTGNCNNVGLLTGGPLFGQDGVRVLSGARAIVTGSLISQNLVNGTGSPVRSTFVFTTPNNVPTITYTENSANNQNLALGAGIRLQGAVLGSFAGSTGQVVNSCVTGSNITDNAYGALNLNAAGTTGATGPVNANPVSTSYGNLLKAENNWWGENYYRPANGGPGNLGPAISPTINPPIPENPVGGTGTTDTTTSITPCGDVAGTSYAPLPTGATGTTTSNSVDFTPYRSGQQASNTGEFAIADAPVPVDDAAPAVTLSAPAEALRGTAVQLAASPSDDFGVRQVRFAEGSTTLGTTSASPFTFTTTIPADAACGSTRTYLARATDSAGQTAVASAALVVRCAADPGPSGPAGPGGTVLAGPGGTVPPPATTVPSVGTIMVPSLKSGSGTLTLTPTAAAGVKQVEVLFGARRVCTITKAPYSCKITATGADVGRQALVVIVTDGNGSQTTAVRAVSVPRFKPRALVLTRSGKRVNGLLRMPANVTQAQGCLSGSVTVVLKRGGRSLSNRQVGLGRKCTFTATRILPANTTLTARFGGNAVLTAATTTRRFK